MYIYIYKAQSNNDKSNILTKLRASDCKIGGRVRCNYNELGYLYCGAIINISKGKKHENICFLYIEDLVIFFKYLIIR